MGRCSEGSSDGGEVLGSSITLAAFIFLGTLRSIHILCISLTVMRIPVSPAPNSSSDVTWSGPHAFFFLSCLML